MKTEFEIWWEGSKYYIPGDDYARAIALDSWKGLGEMAVETARRMNSPRVAGALAQVCEIGHRVHEVVSAHDCRYDKPLNSSESEFEVGQIHD